MIKKISLLTALSVTAFSGWAQENSSSPNSSSEKNADDMVVTANRFAQPVSSVLAPTTIVTRGDIDRWQAKSVADVMRRLPGVDIEQSGGLGQQSTLRIRGSESRHVLILMDGIRLNQAGISGSSDLSQIPLSLVQKIEYIRGARSAVYGSDAIGGVVNIITTREKNGTTLAAGVGSKGYQTYDLATQQTLDSGTTVTLAGNYAYTRGFDIAAADAPRQPDRDGFMSKSIYGAVKQQFNDEFSGFLRGYGFDNRTNYDGYDALDNTTWAVLGTPSIRQLYSQTWDTGLQFNRDIYSSQLVASYSHTKDLNFDPAKGRYSPASTLDDVRQYNLQWANTLTVGAGSASAGVDWQKQTSQPGTSYVIAGHEQRNVGVYATAQQKISSVTLEGAVRGDDNNVFGWHNTWQSSAAWEFIEGYSIFASYGTAYKAPNLNQVYSENYGNLNLKPEESKQWEGGFEGLTGPVNWRLSGYRNDIDNLINFDSTNRYSNIQKARIKGAEATASFDTGPLAHTVSFDYLDPRNSQTNKVLLRRAKQQVKYQLDWAVADIDWSVTYQYLGQRYDTDYNTFQPVKLGGVSLWDLAASYPITSHLTVRGRIANLFDKDYETAYGYRTAGREYYLTGSYTF